MWHSCVHSLLGSGHLGFDFLDSLDMTVIFFFHNWRRIGSHFCIIFSIFLNFSIDSSYSHFQSLLHSFSFNFGFFDGHEMLSIGIDSGVFELIFGSLLSHREFALKNWSWRRWKSGKSFGSCDVTNGGGSRRSLSFWSDIRLGRRSGRNWALRFLYNRLCHNWSWWCNSYWFYDHWSNYDFSFSLDFSCWTRKLSLNSWLTNLLSETGFLLNRFHEKSEWWWLLFDDRESILLNCSDRFSNCFDWFLWRSRSNNWFLSDNLNRLFLLCLDSHQFLSYIYLEFIHIKFWFRRLLCDWSNWLNRYYRCWNNWLLGNGDNWSLNNSSWEDYLWDWLWRNNYLLNSKSWKWFDGWRWRKRSLSWFRRSRNNNRNVGSLLLINCHGFGLTCESFFLYLFVNRGSIWAQRSNWRLKWLCYDVICLSLDFSFSRWSRRRHDLICRWWFISFCRRILLSYFLHFLSCCLINCNCSRSRLLLCYLLTLGIEDHGTSQAFHSLPVTFFLTLCILVKDISNFGLNVSSLINFSLLILIQDWWDTCSTVLTLLF